MPAGEGTQRVPQQPLGLGVTARVGGLRDGRRSTLGPISRDDRSRWPGARAFRQRPRDRHVLCRWFPNRRRAAFRGPAPLRVELEQHVGSVARESQRQEEQRRVGRLARLHLRPQQQHMAPVDRCSPRARPTGVGRIAIKHRGRHRDVAAQPRRPGKRPRQQAAGRPPSATESDRPRTPRHARVEHVSEPFDALADVAARQLDRRAVLHNSRRSGAPALPLCPADCEQASESERARSAQGFALRLLRQPGPLGRQKGGPAGEVDNAAPRQSPDGERSRIEEGYGGADGAGRGPVAPAPAAGSGRTVPRLEEAVPADGAVVHQRDDVRMPERRQRRTSRRPRSLLATAGGRNPLQPDGRACRQIDGPTRSPHDEPIREDQRRHGTVLCKIVAARRNRAETLAFVRTRRLGRPRIRPERAGNSARMLPTCCAF